MSAADLIAPGFYGKLPAAGDFVSRRLPADFVRAWDRWVAQHLAPLLESDIWSERVGLRFLLGPAALGPMAGLVLPSADRVGRRFPLTVAAPTLLATTGFAASAASWFAALHEAAEPAQRGEINADEFAAELALLPFPSADAEGETVRGMIFWTDPLELLHVDTDAPRAALEHLLAASQETS